jgi:hypothetical protein
LDLSTPQRKSKRINGRVVKVPVPEAVTLGQIAGWPHGFRGEDFDAGEPIDCPSY